MDTRSSRLQAKAEALGSTLATRRRSPSTTDRLAAPGFRRFRGDALPADQRLLIVEVEVDWGSTRAFQTRSGACSTHPQSLFCLTSVPHRCSQEAAHADLDPCWRAEQVGLELGYVDESRLLHALLPLLSSSRLPFAIVFV